MTKRVVVASGYFNPLHYGHVSYLEKARDLGTSLIVIVNNDLQAVKHKKDPGGMRLPARERVKLVRSLQCVDAAVESIDEDESVAETLRLLHPDIFANGGGSKPTEQEFKVCTQLGIQMVDGLGIQLLSLTPFTQHYDWGKPRNESIIAALTGQQTPENDKEEDKPFAELWMGDHPSGPARVQSPSGKDAPKKKPLWRSSSLQEVMQRSPSMLGQLSETKQLPFLLKVLSIHKALSIQAHPDKTRAAKLHAERPDVYKDPNHKPEIAIALSDDFQALCGFRSVPEILELLPYVPELVALMGSEVVPKLQASVGDEDKESEALRQAYFSLMHAKDEDMKHQVQQLHARAKKPTMHYGYPNEQLPNNVQDCFYLVCKLYEQYQEDIGIFSVFFMNYVRLSVGECLYMAQNVPHAYISGDIVECMACSDNVVRGGLTPKFKDVDVLCEMLNYKGGPPATLEPKELEKGILLYKDADIQVTHMTIEAGGEQCRLFSSEGPAMALNLSGCGTVTISGETQEVTPGKVFMLAAGAEPELHAKTKMEIFVACCPPEFLDMFFRSPSPSPMVRKISGKS